MKPKIQTIPSTTVEACAKYRARSFSCKCKDRGNRGGSYFDERTQERVCKHMAAIRSGDIDVIAVRALEAGVPVGQLREQIAQRVEALVSPTVTHQLAERPAPQATTESCTCTDWVMRGSTNFLCEHIRAERAKAQRPAPQPIVYPRYSDGGRQRDGYFWAEPIQDAPEFGPFNTRAEAEADMMGRQLASQTQPAKPAPACPPPALTRLPQLAVINKPAPVCRLMAGGR